MERETLIAMSVQRERAYGELRALQIYVWERVPPRTSPEFDVEVERAKEFDGLIERVRELADT